MLVFSCQTEVNLGSKGPRLSFQNHFAVEAYSKIGITIPAGISLSEPVPEYSEWAEPDPDPDAVVEEISDWSMVPLLLNEFSTDPTTVKIQPSDSENVKALVVTSDSYEDLHFTLDGRPNNYRLSGPVLFIESGNISFLGNSVNDFTFHNLGPFDSKLVFIVARNATA